MPPKPAYEAAMNSPVVGRGKIAITKELGDFGEPVDIVPPPARQTAGG